VTKSWRKNLYTTLENMQTDLLCSSPEETVWEWKSHEAIK
jgi:hypothetical protein